jgi:hypothetical protein
VPHNKDRSISSSSVERYLTSKFGDRLGDALNAMRHLVRSMPLRDLAKRGYSLYELYEEFRGGCLPVSTDGALRVNLI